VAPLPGNGALAGRRQRGPLPALNALFGRAEERAPQLAAVGEPLARLPQDGPPVVLVTHQVVISGITDRGVGSGGGYVLRLDGSGKPPVVAKLTVD